MDVEIPQGRYADHGNDVSVDPRGDHRAEQD
jgi:hypothetical protein